MGDIGRARLVGRLIGVGFLISIVVGVYALQIETSIDTSLDALSAMNGEYRDVIAGYKTNAVATAAMVVLNLVIGIGFYSSLRRVSAPWAASAFALRLIDVVLTVASVFLAIRLATIFANAAPGVDPASLSAEAGGPEDLGWRAFHYGLAISSIGMAINFALMFASRIIPRIISAYGTLASLAVTGSIVAMEVWSGAGAMVYPWYTYANGVAYISLTLWLIGFGFDVRRLSPRADW